MVHRGNARPHLALWMQLFISVADMLARPGRGLNVVHKGQNAPTAGAADPGSARRRANAGWPRNGLQWGGTVSLGGGAVVSDAQDVGGLAGHEAQLFDLTA